MLNIFLTIIRFVSQNRILIFNNVKMFSLCSVVVTPHSLPQRANSLTPEIPDKLNKTNKSPQIGLDIWYDRFPQQYPIIWDVCSTLPRKIR